MGVSGRPLIHPFRDASHGAEVYILQVLADPNNATKDPPGPY